MITDRGRLISMESAFLSRSVYPSRNGCLRHLLLKYAENGTVFIGAAEIFKTDPRRLKRWSLKDVRILHSEKLPGECYRMAYEELNKHGG
ncbi:hypothetical protein M3221_00380 [Domibacillus indicus]|uniref:hypothetical protein n=1 Tax=Domibacillus indicus TaxID=1437523 RepID=UPI00204239ED|nr:hypothetical protein [Domibacillus indicus]MCM3786886.1 hypothetical protein [Domibacillus indicus]